MIPGAIVVAQDVRVSEEQADARSTMTGRIVDSYTNIQTVKLFSHARREAGYARESMAGFMDTVYRSMRLVTSLYGLVYLLNGLLLLCITFVPFPTSLLAEYIEHDGQTVAASVYAGTFTVTAIVFNAVWRYAARRGRLLRASADPTLVRTISRQYVVGPLLYFSAFLLAFISVTASVAVCAFLALVFALPISWLRR